jgi:hypothetical protein
MEKVFFIVGIIDKKGRMPAGPMSLNQRSMRSNIQVFDNKVILTMSPLRPGKELLFSEIIEVQHGGYPWIVPGIAKNYYISFKFKENEKIISYTFVAGFTQIKGPDLFGGESDPQIIISALNSKVPMKKVDNPVIITNFVNKFWKIFLILIIVVVVVLFYEIFIFIPSLL